MEDFAKCLNPHVDKEVNTITEANNVDYNKAAEVMNELLYDEGNSTYKMFNDLVGAYLDKSDEFKAGFDRACEILVANNMKGIAQKIIDAN